MKSVFDLPFHPEPPSLSFCPSFRCFGKLGHDGVEFTIAYAIALPQGLKASDVCVKVNICSTFRLNLNLKTVNYFFSANLRNNSVCSSSILADKAKCFLAAL